MSFGTFFLPGPTEVRPEILAEMARPMMGHRGVAFEAIYAEIDAGMRTIFRTTQPVLMATASATGLMEGAVRAMPPGPVLCIVHGAFSERFARIAEACGHPVEQLEFAWGTAPDLDAIRRTLSGRQYAGVTVVHSETSTGVTADIAAIAALAREHGATCAVDSVTGLAGAPVETDGWQLPFVLTGSQKALALPPGLAFGVAQPDFVQAAHQGPARGLYLDVVELEAFARKHQTPNTPAISLFYAAQAQVRAIVAEGIEARWARHAAMASATWQWVEGLSASLGAPFGVLAPAGARSATVTCVTLPPSLTGGDIVRAVEQRGFVIGGGYGKLKDRTIRIGHMGDHTVTGLQRCLAAVEDAIRARLTSA